MGGCIILPVIMMSILLWADLKNIYVWLVMLIILGFGLVGFLDDYLKSVRKDSHGLSAKAKFSLQVLVALIVAIVLYLYPGFDSCLNVPFFKGFNPDLGWLYIPFSVLVIVGASNAVNLTDGLDGLAGGTVAIALGAYGIIAYLQGQSYLVTFCFVVVGACLAFLWFNAYPALLFMGDTGALSLGATLGVVGLMTGQWLLLPVVGVVFVAEALSVVLQVAYFRWGGGKRLFRMAPLHHHLELRGWSEVQVVQRFWLIGMMAAMLGVALALA